MDYTTLARLKTEVNITEAGDDVRLPIVITGASRAIDRKLTGENSTESTDYLLYETVTDQLLNGRLDNIGNVVCYAHKPAVTSVAAMSYKFKPSESWIPIDAGVIVPDGIRIEAWTEKPDYSPCKVFVKITYNGGFAVDTVDLPGDIIEAATVLAVRFWREAQSGLADVIGVAEIGQLIYTKAWPVLVLDMLQPFMRRMPWRGVG